MEETEPHTHTQQVTHEQEGPRYWMNGALLCNAHNGAGALCGGIAVRGKTKCRKHGGRSLSGLASATFQHGRYSKDLPAQTASRAEAARHNPRLLSLSDDIAVLEARLAECFAQAERGDSATLWRDLQAARGQFRQAMASGDTETMLEADATIERLIMVGGNQAAAWHEIADLMVKRAKLVQTEVKTLQGLQQMITVQQNQLMLGAVMNAVVEAVQAFTDVPSGRKILMQVGAEMTRLSTLEGR